MSAHSYIGTNATLATRARKPNVCTRPSVAARAYHHDDLAHDLDVLHQRMVSTIKSVADKRKRVEDLRAATLTTLRSSIRELLQQELDSIKNLSNEICDQVGSDPADTASDNVIVEDPSPFAVTVDDVEPTTDDVFVERIEPRRPPRGL